MNKILIVFLCLFLINSILIAANVGKIAGIVKDAETGEPLVGANILIDTRYIDGKPVKMEYPTGAYTDLDGSYFVLNLRPGLYDVKVSYVGYKTQIKTKVRVDVDKTTRVDFNMESTTIVGEEVSVIAFAEKPVEPDLTATKQTYTVQEVGERIAGVTSLTDILDLQADVVDNHFRGGREGESVYILGNAEVVNPLNQSRAFNPMVSAIEQVEVYTSGFSAEYGNAQSGVVNMVAREGGERWVTTIDASSTLPYYRMFVGEKGGNYYSSEMQPFYPLFLNEEEWLKSNPQDPNTSNLAEWAYLVGGETREDSLYVARLRKAEYMNHFYRMGMDMKNRLDTRFDITTGGPLSRRARIFLAARQELNHYRIPIQEPNKNRQIISNLVYHLSGNDKLKLSYIYNFTTNNYIQAGTAGHQGLQAEFIFRQEFRDNTMNNYGLEWMHVFSRATFMQMNFNILETKWQERTAYMDPDTSNYTEKRSGNGWYHPLPFPGTGWLWDTKAANRGKEHTLTYMFKGDLTSQINKFNLMKTGVQFKYYDLDVFREYNFTVGSTRQILDFNNKPYEGAIYIQDKMEFEGMIANIGLRFDFYDFNTEYYLDKYSPIRNPYYDPTKPYKERGPFYDRNLALKGKTELYTRLQPRFGVSFPISEGSVFHANYGTFTQRPPFNYVFYNRINTANQVIQLGNPTLRPENTTAYDVGVVQMIPLGIKFEASAYYKDVKDLLESAYFTDSNQNTYQTFHNVDYAMIKGFHLSLEKSLGIFSGIVRYNFEKAMGKSSSPFDAPINYVEATGEQEENTVEYPDPKDIYLNYDRTHKLVTHLTFTTPNKFGFSISGFRPLENLLFSVTYRYMSGRPYTYDEKGEGLKMNQRTPDEHDMKIRIQKGIRIGKYNVQIYLDGFNILNERVYSYGWVFNNKQHVQRYHQDPENFLYETEYAPYLRRWDYHFIQNKPRHFRLGLKLRF